MIYVTHSCGDCGFVSGEAGFSEHHRRAWHRLVIDVGLEAALKTHLSRTSPDARRAVDLFVIGEVGESPLPEWAITDPEERKAAWAERLRGASESVQGTAPQAEGLPEGCTESEEPG